MADFETHAAAAVTTLQEIDGMNESAGVDFRQAAPDLEQMATQYRQLNETLKSAFDSLEGKVSAAKTDHHNRVTQLKAKMNVLQEKADVISKSLKTSIVDHEDTIKTTDDFIDTMSDDAKEMVAAVVADIDVTQNNLVISNDAIDSGFTKLDKSAADASDNVDNLMTMLDEKANGYATFLEETCATEMQQSVDTTSWELKEMATVWTNGIDNQVVTLRQTAQTVPKAIADNQDSTQDIMNEAVDKMREIYDDEKFITTVSGTKESVDDMNEQMKGSEKAYEDLGDVFNGLAQVLRKIASA